MNTKMKAIGLFAIALLALTALVGSAQANDMPDLNVSSISINPGDTRADEIIRFYVNEDNTISADVWNNGTAEAGPFDVCFKDDLNSINIGTVNVPDGLEASTSTTVSIEWTPTCTDYPVMPGFPPQALPITINVTANCNGAVTESDETNNTLLKHIPAIQVWNKTGWMAGFYDVMGGVVNNGYKSKELDCDPSEEPLTLFEYDEICGCGGIAYNVSGVKTTIGAEDNSTRVHHIDIPDGATVKKARLYVYWYDYWFHYFEYSKTGCMADFEVDFNDTSTVPTTVPLAAMYNDQKGFGAYANPKGTYAYDVTSLVSGSGDYTVKVYNDRDGTKTTLLGEMLYVVYDYEGAPCGKTIQLWTLEGNDYLMQGNVTHPSSGGYKFGVTAEEATATVAFPGTIEDSTNKSATLVTVVAQGRTTGMDMLFNDNIVKTDAWDVGSEAYPKSKICVESVDVTACLAASGNNMGFRDTGTDGMQASNAFLIVEEAIPVDVDIRPGSCPNSLNLQSMGKLSVAVLGTEDFDVTTIDPEKIRINRCCDGCVGAAPIRWSYKDVATPFTGELCDCHDLNGDGYIDLTLKFENHAQISNLNLGMVAGETIPLTLTGNLKAENCGKPIKGEDCIRVLG